LLKSKEGVTITIEQEQRTRWVEHLPKKGDLGIEKTEGESCSSQFPEGLLPHYPQEAETCPRLKTTLWAGRV